MRRFLLFLVVIFLSVPAQAQTAYFALESGPSVIVPDGWAVKVHNERSFEMTDGSYRLTVIDPQTPTRNLPPLVTMSWGFNQILRSALDLRYEPDRVETLDLDGREVYSYRFDDDAMRFLVVPFSGGGSGLVFGSRILPQADDTTVTAIIASFDTTIREGVPVAPVDLTTYLAIYTRLSETFTTPEGIYRLRYNPEWQIRYTDTMITLLGEDLNIELYSPHVVRAWGLGYIQEPDGLVLAVASQLGGQLDGIRRFSDDGVDMAWSAFTSFNNEQMLLGSTRNHHGGLDFYIGRATDVELLTRTPFDSLSPVQQTDLLYDFYVLYSTALNFDLAAPDYVPGRAHMDLDGFDLERTYVIPGGAYQVMYPQGWRVWYDSQNGRTVLTDGTVDVAFFDPASLRAWGHFGVFTPETLLETWSAAVLPGLNLQRGDIFRSREQPAFAQASIYTPGGTFYGYLVAVTLSDGDLAIAMIESTERSPEIVATRSQLNAAKPLTLALDRVPLPQPQVPEPPESGQTT